MSEGWIKLHRCLMDKAIWKCSTPEQKTILITLLMMANHKPNEWEWNGIKYTVKAGQFITSLKSIAEKSGSGISIKNVRTALEKFEKYGFLANKSTNKNRLITIENWETYQENDDESASKSASNRQAIGKQSATNKNDKNEKNEKKDIYIIAQHLSITKTEYEKLVEQYGQKNVDEKIEYAQNYAKLNNYKSLYLTLNNWLKKDVGEKPKELKPLRLVIRDTI